jgi:DNA polymerase III epsilon subunit-like protein
MRRPTGCGTGWRRVCTLAARTCWRTGSNSPPASDHTAHRAVADALTCRAVWQWLDVTTQSQQPHFDNLNDDELVRQAWFAYMKAKELNFELMRYKDELIKRASGSKYVSRKFPVYAVSPSRGHWRLLNDSITALIGMR